MPEDNNQQRNDVALDLIKRLFRDTGLADRRGVGNVLSQLEIAPIPIGAVNHIATSIMKASIHDKERIRLQIPLVYIWLEAYMLGQKGAKKQFFFAAKELAQEQLAGKNEEPEIGEEGA